jgi:UDP-N-acetylmuramoyl-tripeptide--D-alanyl-D-alanine ligase
VIQAPLLTVSELEDALAVKAQGGNPGGFSSVAIDSRQVRPGGLFVALKGENADGHDYAAEALKRGASVIIAERGPAARLGLAGMAGEAGAALLAVEDSLSAFQRAAAAYIDKFPGLLRIAVTGSAGKTTTKEIAAAIIGCERACIVNPGNLNSETGLPLAVFGIRPGHQAGIFEMGMNRPGEIGELAAVLRPQIALVTNIGTAHIGKIGSCEGIAAEKKAVFSQFTGKETALIPAEDDFAEYLGQGVNGKVKFYGPHTFGGLSEIHDLNLEGSELIWEGKAARLGLPGRHNLQNALGAIAIAAEIPVSAEAVRQGLAAVKPLFGRGEVIRGEVTVIQDCYNANLEAVLAALDFCDQVTWKGRKVYIIGPMLELGDYAEEAHRRVGEALASSQAYLVLLYGEETRPALEALAGPGAPECHYAATMEELYSAAEALVSPGDLVLLKGSRGAALEQLLPVFQREERKCS